MENEMDDLESLNQEEAVPETVEESVPETEELTKAQQLAQNYKIRAEKAERENKALKTKELPKDISREIPKEAKVDSLSIKDIKALSDIHDDDIDSVVDWAKFKGLTVAEAKNTMEMKNLLRIREEERASAIVASTGPAKRSSSKISDEILLEKLAKGELADDEMERAAKARINQKKAKLGT